MKGNYTYMAFISYKRDDEEWANWLQKKLENYKLPISVKEENSKLPDRIRPIFRDATDLSGGTLSEALKEGLNNSQFLIVICSPRSAKSKWVNKEVQEFINTGKKNQIIPFIIEGHTSTNDDTQCLPEALRNLSNGEELLGININEAGRETAFIKVVARMLQLRFDTLWERHKRQERRKRLFLFSALTALLLAAIGVASWIFIQNNRLEEINRHMLISQSKAVAEKARQEIAKGNVLNATMALLEVMPDNHNSTNRPYVAEAEAALRVALDSIYSGFYHYFTPDKNGSTYHNENHGIIEFDEQNRYCFSDNKRVAILDNEETDDDNYEKRSLKIEDLSGNILVEIHPDYFKNWSTWAAVCKEEKHIFIIDCRNQKVDMYSADSLTFIKSLSTAPWDANFIRCNHDCSMITTINSGEIETHHFINHSPRFIEFDYTAEMYDNWSTMHSDTTIILEGKEVICYNDGESINVHDSANRFNDWEISDAALAVSIFGFSHDNSYMYVHIAGEHGYIENNILDIKSGVCIWRQIPEYNMYKVSDYYLEELSMPQRTYKFPTYSELIKLSKEATKDFKMDKATRKSFYLE